MYRKYFGNFHHFIWTYLYEAHDLTFIHFSTVTPTFFEVFIKLMCTTMFERYKPQSKTKFMKQWQDIKQNRTGQENFEISICIISDH